MIRFIGLNVNVTKVFKTNTIIYERVGRYTTGFIAYIHTRSRKVFQHLTDRIE